MKAAVRRLPLLIVLGLLLVLLLLLVALLALALLVAVVGVASCLFQRASGLDRRHHHGVPGQPETARGRGCCGSVSNRSQVSMSVNSQPPRQSPRRADRPQPA